ncbi:hypothetical protein SanaruYs_09560 [Chryseotalea sanaruensis]|uniref:Anti-sigma K factor RskA C-terminal domain-containing protein n=1 Tax=Chryseotalea sanaruensis TaxID=2482724 RepID=A0A401U782_9BACT|nr:anti-sigma factor [Chryseotalea sanaruensis]GCC50738.1 hypothetical protein SanaruYs_09560 [Chryseotalea sanaruensis]
MNLEEYISSGVLEAYAAGLLAENERKEVEQNVQLYPALKTELEQIEATQELLLMKGAIQPASNVKALIFEALDQQNDKKVIPLKSTNNQTRFWQFAVAASLSLAIISSFLAYNYYNKWRTTVISFNDLLTRNQQIAEDYNTVNNRISEIETDLRVMNNPDFKRVVMKGTDNAPQALAAVYWNENSQEVYLSLQNMKALSKENQYQLWAIIDGKPVDAGVFDGNLAGLIKMKNIGQGAAAFAVTIEPKGGKSSPTLETMQVIGNTTAV